MLFTDFYRDEILDHYRHPRHKYKMSNVDVVATETNASCGDELTLYLIFQPNGRIKQASFTGHGCAISQAAMSMLVDMLPELNRNELDQLKLEDIIDLLGGSINPGRVKCAALGLRALQQALKKNKE